MNMKHKKRTHTVIRKSIGRGDLGILPCPEQKFSKS